MINDGITYWITGLSGAGKTTIGNRLYYELKKSMENVVLLDGDVMKSILEEGGLGGYSDKERRKRAYAYAKMCKLLSDQGIIVICCTIAMYDEVRKWNRKNNNGYVEVFLDVPIATLQLRDQKGLYSLQKEGKIQNLAGVDLQVEFPQNPDILIKNDGRYSIQECVEIILNYKTKMNTNANRDTNYWNKYYEDNGGIEVPSSFACTVADELKKGDLLDLGCGNGRDSIFFSSLGINVTGVDASDGVIRKLQKRYKGGNIYFVCDDFVHFLAMSVVQYDYCYSRFSLHAISEEQENEVIANVWRVLKENGKFLIEVRSVNDDIFGKGEKVGRNAFYYNGHFRRFLVKEELEKKLVKAGFSIEYLEEALDFAPFGDENPLIIRCIASKKL